MQTPRHDEFALEHPLRPALLVGALYFGGMALGLALTGYLAPNSPMATFVGFLVWPLSFGIGMSLWYTVARSNLIPRLLRAILQSIRTFDLEGSLRQEFYDASTPIPQTRVFVPVTVCFSFFAGLIIACSPTAKQFELVVTAYTAAGLSYGMLVTWLARHGYLTVPMAK